MYINGYMWIHLNTYMTPEHHEIAIHKKAQEGIKL